MGSNFCRPISSLPPALLHSNNVNELSTALQNIAATSREQRVEAAARVLATVLQANNAGEEFFFDLSLFQSEEWRCLEAALPSFAQPLQERIRQIKQGLLAADQPDSSGVRDGFVNNSEIIQWVQTERSQGRTLWANPTQFRHAAQIITQSLPATLSRIGTRSENPTAVANRVWLFLRSYALSWKERLEHNPRILNEAGIDLGNWTQIVSVYGIPLNDFLEENPQTPPTLIQHLLHDLQHPEEAPQLSQAQASALHWVAQIEHSAEGIEIANSPTAPLTPLEFERLYQRIDRAAQEHSSFYGMQWVKSGENGWQDFSARRSAVCEQNFSQPQALPACIGYVVQNEADVGNLLPVASFIHLAFSSSPSQHKAIRAFMEGSGVIEDLSQDPRNLGREILSPFNGALLVFLSLPFQRLIFNQALRLQCRGNVGNAQEAWENFQSMERSTLQNFPQLQTIHSLNIYLFIGGILGNALDKVLSTFDIDTHHLFGDTPAQALTGILLSQGVNGILNNSMRHFFRIYPQAFCRQTPPVEVSAPEPESTPVVERSPAPAERQVSEYRGPTMVDVAWEGSKNFVRENGLKVLGGAAIIVGGALILDDITGGGVLDDGIAAVLIRVGTRWLGRSAATGAVLQTVRAR